jgi:hypothetical protein
MIDLDYICFLNETGYGQAAYDLIQSLIKSEKYNIKISCLNGNPNANFLATNSLDKMLPLVKKKSTRKHVQVYHCIPSMFARYPRNEKAIGFATFETYEPPKAWIDILNNMDAVICPSQFNYKIFAHAGIKRPLFYVPHCFDDALYNKNVVRLQKFDKFTFLFAGTWKKRKGWPQLIEAFFREFSNKDNVQLLLKTDKVQTASQDIEKMRVNMNLGKEYPPILFERRIFDDEHLPSFYKSADCLVMPTLGEGFGLPALQCMAVGTPVIVTNFSGCQDYAAEDRCTLIEPSGFVLQSTMDNITQFNNKKWPRLTVQSIQDAMRSVFTQYDQAKVKADKAYDYVHANFNFGVASSSFNKVMESIYRVS